MRPLALVITAVLFLFSCRKSDLPSAPDPKPQPLPLWKIYTTANSSLPDNQVNAIAIDRADVKWIGTAKGLVRLAGSVWTKPDLPGLPEPYITSIAVDSDGIVWVGTTKGLASYRDSVWTVFTKQNSQLPDNEIMCMTHDAKNKITWVATSKGFVSIKDKTWTVIDDIDHELILSMTTDKNGALWMGTFNHFAFRGNVRKYYDGKWTGFTMPDLGYYSAFPYAIAVDNADNVIVTLTGTAVREIIRYSNGSWQELEFPDAARGFKSLLVEGEKIWVAGKDLALVGNKSSATIAIPETDSPIQCLAIDSKGSKWLGTTYGGLAIYSNK